MNPTASSSIAGVILAGGQGRRLQGADKGLVELAGRAMIAHVIERFAPQVGSLMISANRNVAAYERFGYPVLGDNLAGFAGPLAGIAAAMEVTDARFLAVVPCDSPFLPTDLISRLAVAVESPDGTIAVARAADRLHPVFALIATRLRESLFKYLAGGERKIDRWYRQHQMIAVDFDDDEEAFANINTPDERRSAEGRLSPTGS